MVVFDLKLSVLYFCVMGLYKFNIVCFGFFVYNVCSLKVFFLPPQAESSQF